MTTISKDDTYYEKFQQQRNSHTDKVVKSCSPKRLVMAGPGTGKSTLFQLVAKQSRESGKSKIIVLTFINELVCDLTQAMHGLAEVSTLHSFAAKQLKSSRQAINLHLLQVLDKDYFVQTGEKVDFQTKLYELRLTDQSELDFLDSRREYYKSFDPTTIVFDLVRKYEQNPSLIPVYDLILIDEFQDFNQLESRLIELLASKSDVLIAGDDDQSLYDFKLSRPENIRGLHRGDDFENFELPFCSRSTKVIIDAFHDVIGSAITDGHLADRVDKQFRYFPDKKKDRLSDDHAKIISATGMQESKIAFFIDKYIREIFEYEPKFDVLVICSLSKQVERVSAGLRKKGFKNVSGDGSDPGNKLVDGLKILDNDKDSSLGWRICAEFLMIEADLNAAINTSKDCQKIFSQCLPAETVKLIKKLRAISQKLKKNRPLIADEQTLLLKYLEIDPLVLAESTAHTQLFGNSANAGAMANIPIKVTSILKSKGLSYDYVFMVNFDDRFLINKEINDLAINGFIVALTRTRKKAYIFSSQSTEATFTGWISLKRKTMLSA